jgi:hypothetical protein
MFKICFYVLVVNGFTTVENPWVLKSVHCLFVYFITGKSYLSNSMSFLPLILHFLCWPPESNRCIWLSVKQTFDQLYLCCFIIIGTKASPQPLDVIQCPSFLVSKKWVPYNWVYSVLRCAITHQCKRGRTVVYKSLRCNYKLIEPNYMRHIVRMLLQTVLLACHWSSWSCIEIIEVWGLLIQYSAFNGKVFMHVWKLVSSLAGCIKLKLVNMVYESLNCCFMRDEVAGHQLDGTEYILHNSTKNFYCDIFLSRVKTGQNHWFYW